MRLSVKVIYFQISERVNGPISKGNFISSPSKEKHSAVISDPGEVTDEAEKCF